MLSCGPVSMNWGLIGNERAIQVLVRSLAGPTPPHAYLLAGPEGVGKAAAARRLAQTVNCLGETPPCGGCEQCRRIAAGIHADVQTVSVRPGDEGPQHKAISVEQIREVGQSIALNPFEGRNRVVIIDPADAMTTEAQNAFLKTLEEPPPHVLFVLITAAEEALLETVRSRCRRVELRLVPLASIEQALRDMGIEEGQAGILARLSQGRPGWALTMAGDEAAMARRNTALASAHGLASMSIADRMDLAERLSDEFKRDREGALWLLAQWRAYWRDVLLIQSGAADAVANIDQVEALRQHAGGCAREEVIAFVQALLDTRGYLESNVQSRLALESLLLRVPGARAAAR